MQVLRRLRARGVHRSVLEQRAFYGRDWTAEAAQASQLEQFNQVWATAIRSVPYFAMLHRERGLPAEFRTWDEFKAIVPTMDRADLQRERDALASRDRPGHVWRTTGGSTAQPIQIPVWRSELRVATEDLWYGRDWFRVVPEDRLFLIWGHSHLFGRGARGWLNAKTRQLKDRLLAYRRWSAYDLSEAGLRRAGDELLRFRPSYIVSYAVALDRFARVNRDHGDAFHRVPLKAAIATAESFPTPDSRATIKEILGCPVAMEYGSVETGPIAHEAPSGQYMVFWRHYFVEVLSSVDVPGAHEILVTSLFPRSVPLVRYRVGDLIRFSPGGPRPWQEFDSVIGRCNDYVLVGSGQAVHSEAFAHVVKDVPAIAGYQVTQRSDGWITLTYLGGDALGARELAEVRHRLQRVSPALAGIDIRRVDSLERTIAGKTRSVVRARGL